MKRQRRVDGVVAIGAAVDQAPRFESKATTTMLVPSKKAKKVAVEKEEVRIDGGDHQLGFVTAENVIFGDENYWGCLDEQMSWGSIWSPFWDVEFMGEAQYGLFSDVIWDDDIWGLRTTKEIPNP